MVETQAVRLGSVSGFTGLCDCTGLNLFNFTHISQTSVCHYMSSWQIKSKHQQQCVLTPNGLNTSNLTHTALTTSNNKQDNVITVLCLIRLQTKMNDSQTVRGVLFRTV